jgi:hypothetical protein
MIEDFEMVAAGAARAKASLRGMPTRGGRGSLMRSIVVAEKDEVVTECRQFSTGMKVIRGPQRWFSLGTAVMIRVSHPAVAGLVVERVRSPTRTTGVRSPTPEVKVVRGTVGLLVSHSQGGLSSEISSQESGMTVRARDE